MLSTQITIRDFKSTESIQNHINKRLQKLNKLCKQINFCHVIIEKLKKTDHKDKAFSVHIDTFIPGKELAVNRVKDNNLHIAIRDAFDSIQRSLSDYIQRKHQQLKHPIKTHDELLVEKDNSF